MADFHYYQTRNTKESFDKCFKSDSLQLLSWQSRKGLDELGWVHFADNDKINQATPVRASSSGSRRRKAAPG